LARTPFISVSSKYKPLAPNLNNLEKKIVDENYDKPLFIYNGSIPIETNYFNFKNYKEIFNDQELLNAKAFIFSELNIHLLSFGINYNIPNIWIHKTIKPENWNNLFRLIIIGEQNNIEVWRSIWKLV